MWILKWSNLASKPGVIEQRKFEYSPTGQAFNKRTVEANISNKKNQINQIKIEKVNQNLYNDPRYGFFKYRYKNCHPHLHLRI